MTRSTFKRASTPPSSSHQTLEQYLASQPSIYIVAENLHPRDLSKTKGEEGYRILGAFLTVEVANEYARKYAYGLKKWGQSPKGSIWAEEDLELVDGAEGIKRSTDEVDGTDEYVVAWSHFTNIKVARWSVRDTVPKVDSRTEFFDRVDFVVDAGAADSIYGGSDDEDDHNSDEEDEEDSMMEDIKDELQGLDMDRKIKAEQLVNASYHSL
ncbi:hypothetical protein TruAng_002431 [Truncatella angustata]|nr:hypothetical protein TruAng_002431 [Truncatella angustata]